MKQNFQADFDVFNKRKSQLIDLVSRTKSIMQDLDLQKRREELDLLERKISSDTFKMLVLGEFKRGKSTFINALLGTEILPAFAIPCTAVINEIRYAEEKKAIVHFSDTLSEELPEGLASEAKEYIRQYKGKTIPPMTIPINDLEHYVVIQDPGTDHGQAVAETPYELVEIYWPIELCRNGVVIIDSPGLNEHKTRTSITKNYLQKVDAVIYVMSCHALAGKYEMKILDRDVRSVGHKEIFMVCNRFDEINERDQDKLKKFGRTELSKKTSFGEKGVYFISSLDALEGKLQGNAAMIQRSGIQPLEEDISNFLIKERGKIKICQPARELHVQIDQIALEEIPMRHAMLNEDLIELEKRFNEVKPSLEIEERRSEQIIRQFNLSRKELRNDAEWKISMFLKEISGKIPEWLEDYDPENKIEFVSTEGIFKQSKKLLDELSGFVTDKIEDDFSVWIKDKFTPFLEKKLSNIAEVAEKDIKKLLKSLETIRSKLAGTQITIPPNVNLIGRIISGVGGILWGDLGAGWVGIVFGLKAMISAMIPNFALAVGMVLIGIANPAVFFGILIGAGAIQGAIRAKSTTKKLKKIAAKEMAENMEKQAADQASEMAESVYEKTSELAEMIREGLGREIESIRERFETVIADIRKGETNVKEKQVILHHAGKNIRSISSELNEIMLSFA